MEMIFSKNYIKGEELIFIILIFLIIVIMILTIYLVRKELRRHDDK